MDKVTVYKGNEVYNVVRSSRAVEQELSEYFKFLIPNHRFNPKVKLGVWDGYIRLYSIKDKTIYAGLLNNIKKFCAEREYELEIEDDLDVDTEFSVKEAKEFIDSLDLPKGLEERDYQLETFVHCVRKGRVLMVSPTSSGKSFMIYLLVRYYNTKTLLIVDSINLLNQMYSDFESYGFDVDEHVHLVHGKSAKNSDKPIIVTTWQSAAKQPKEWFDKFELVIGDEAHKYKANSLKTIMESLEYCEKRFGFTGTLDDIQVNKLVLEGLFGPYHQIISTAEMIERNFASELDIKCIILQYPEEERKLLQQSQKTSKNKYSDELKFLFGHKKRNNFIKNLALSLKGNTLVLFYLTDKHGVPLFEAIKAEASIPVYYVAGDVEGEDREYIRKIVNTHENSIIVASVGTFSTGVNIPVLNNIINAVPTKSKIRLLQTIGRGLRKSDGKFKCTFYDLADDLSIKKKLNYTLKHFSDRLKIYIKEKFKYKIYKVQLGSTTKKKE